MSDRFMLEQISQNGNATYDRVIAETGLLAPEEGIRHIKQFLITFPSFALAHNDLAVLYHRIGNSTLALAHYEKAARMQPDNVTIRKNLADFYAVELGWLEDAVDIYMEVLKRNPRDSEALIALGQIGSAMESQAALPLISPEPLKIATSCITFPAVPASVAGPVTVTAPLSPAPERRTTAQLYEQAMSLAATGQNEAAITELQGLLAQEPGFAPACNDLGVLFQKIEDIEQARYYQQLALDMQPENNLYRKNLADLLFMGVGDHEAALTHYNQLLAKNPRDVEVLHALALICIDLGVLDDARHFLEKLLAVQPWDRDSRETLQKLNEMKTAQPIAVGAVKSAQELYHEALALVQAEKLPEAKAVLETLLLSTPSHALAYNDLGVISYRLGDLASAERHYQKAAELEPANANYQKNMADLYFSELGRTDDAIHIYLDLMKKYPRDVEVMINLGHICTSVGHSEEAKSFYRRALEIEPWNKEAREALQPSAQASDKVFF